MTHGGKHKIVVIAGVVVVVIAAVTIGLTVGLRGILRRNVETVLRERFESDVEIKDLQVFVFPRIHVQAHSIVLRFKGRRDIPPLMTIEKLTLVANLWGMLWTPKRIASVHLDGLQIHIPPRQKGEARAAAWLVKRINYRVVIDEISSDDALLQILPKQAGKQPLDFDLHRIVLQSYSLDEPASFHATLTNPKPVGEIDSEGQFGPWQADDPGGTPVAGAFHFSNADLATLHGISGNLSSNGKYSGVLDQLNVEGDTNTPDFALRTSGNPVSLSTHYVAVVDGTNGNTYLKSVEAHFLHSVVVSSGEVVKTPGVKGRRITLDAIARNARVEDFLRLTVKGSKPPMTGSVSLHVKLDLQTGQGDIIDGMLLDGQFGIAGVQFSDSAVQDKVDALSRGGQGEPKNEDIEDVISHLRGRFVLRDGKAKFSNLAFDVTGAAVTLSGSYDLDSEKLDFHGHLLLDAKLSQTTTGAKSFFLKFADPFFKKNGGGSSVPIKVTGTRSKPSFGLELGRGDPKK